MSKIKYYSTIRMAKVFDTPVYSDYKLIEPGNSVSIIEKQYTKFNPMTFATHSISDDKFMGGTYMGSKIVQKSNDGRGGKIEYTVKLNDGKTVIFNNYDNIYYFKANPNPKPLSGGRKKNIRKRNTKKTKKNYRKLSRRR